MKLYARKTGSGQGVIADEEGAGKTIAVTYNEEDAFMLAHRAMVHDELVEALETVRAIIVDGAITGFDCHSGDWANRLFESQSMSHNALRNANQNNR